VPTNLELKARVTSISRATEQARNAGAEERGVLFQTDTYFKVQRGRLKLRETADGAAELVQYERQEDSSERWSRYRKVDVCSAGVLKAALAESLGIVSVVRKERRLFFYRGARIHLDNVDGLGSFIEFEVPADREADPAALMKDLRGIFEIAEDSIEKGSYSDLLSVKSSLLES
jgi:predicted adenylyl cyclase CyaB